MFARGAFPLCLLLLAWTYPTRVSCQNITVEEVSSEYVEVTWTRNLLWLGVEDFQVTVSPEDSSVCIMSVPCTTATCTFNSLLCGLLFPCTPTNITISGGSYTATTVSRVTGPGKVSDLEIDTYAWAGHITWVNPSMDTSPCYEKTAVKVYYDDEAITSYFSDEETMNMSLCVVGSGVVEAWTEGGDGHSNSTWTTFTHNYTPDLVEFEDCEPVDCTAIEVEWSYNPKCPDVHHISVHVGGNTFNTSVSTTNLTVTDLTFDSEYDTSICAMRKDGKVLHTTSTHHCVTRCEVPENLVVEALNSSSLRVTWDPPLCPMEPPVPYLLMVEDDQYTTNATTYDVGGLLPFSLSRVQVQMKRSEYYNSKYMVYTYSRTLAPTPTLSIDNVQSDSVDVSWESNLHDYYYSAVFELTWGTDLQFKEETLKESFTIVDFNSTDEVYIVCVATILNGEEDLVSEADCKLLSSAQRDPHDGLSGGAIAGIVIGSVFVIGLLAGLCVAWNKNKNSEARTLQTQTQQQGIHQEAAQKYNYRVYNPAASQ